MRSSPGNASGRQNSNQSSGDLSPSAPLEEARSNVSKSSDLKASQDKTMIMPHEAQAIEARRLKALGNEAMVDQQYPRAVDLYTQAMKLSLEDETYHCLSLRAGAHNSMGNYKAACQDAEAAIKGQPENASAWNRLGRAKLSMDSSADLQASVTAYLKAMEYGGQGASEGLQAAQKKLWDLENAEARSKKPKDVEEAVASPTNPTDSEIQRPRMLAKTQLEEPSSSRTLDRVLSPNETSVRDPPSKSKKSSIFSRVFKVD